MEKKRDLPWDGVDRRNSGDRRSGMDRRSHIERRSGHGNFWRKRSLSAWIRTFTNPRLGVDRRKGFDQRSSSNRRRPRVRTLLTREELIDLLK